MSRRGTDFETIRSEGGLLPSDLLRRVTDPTEKLAGTRPEDYGLPHEERLTEVITPAWNRLRKHWSEFRQAAASLPDGEPGTGLTNDKWSLPLLRELGFGLLPTSAGPEISGRTYAISRFFGHVPVHLVGCGLSLDRRAAGVRGAAAANPHGLVQEVLNRSADCLWGVVGNGLRLRILRDSQSLSRQSFLEFDLEAMFAGEIYSDFVLLWLVAHATRFVPLESDKPDSCWLELWTKEGNKQGTRVLGDLRVGVERALQILGEGFTSHSANMRLREALRAGTLSLVDFHGQLLRVVYRLIFLSVAEDRTIDGQPLLHPRDESEHGRLARQRYLTHYSTTRFRELASSIRGSQHADLWRQFQTVVGALSGDMTFVAAREKLALPALGSFLWAASSTVALTECQLTNYDLLEAIRHLAFTRRGKVLRSVDFKNLGAEELGGVYESLLALTPQISADGARFSFAELAGNERKISGSYYTPESLVQVLLDSALDPVVTKATQNCAAGDAERAILAIKVCDPAVGSGHFLVGAAHRLARHLSHARAFAQGDSAPSPLLYQHALRDVIGRCLYGVDANPMAAELCRVSLWLEALEPGKPLSFLDHHIRVGNSLLGTTPELIAAGLPDKAFSATDGDEKQACAFLKKRNEAERKGVGPLFAREDAEMQLRLQQAASTLEELPDDRPEDIRIKELAFRQHEQTDEFRNKKQLADAWCAAFVIRKYFVEGSRQKEAFGITHSFLTLIANHRIASDDAPLIHEVERLASAYGFFHWHLSFPEVFARGGFDAVLGNPPWKLTEDDSRLEVEADSSIDADLAIAAASNELKRERGFFARSGRFPRSGQNRLQLARLFSELFDLIRGPHGAAGIIVPSTLTVNAFDRVLWSSWVHQKQLASVWDFVNFDLLFPEVDARQKFAVLCLGADRRDKFRARCWMTDPAQVISEPDEVVELSEADLIRYSGDELALPHFRRYSDLVRLDAAITSFGRVSESSEWRTDYLLLGATNDRVFVEQRRRYDAEVSRREAMVASSDWVPVYEGKMVGVLDHRVARVVWKAKNAKRRAQEEPLSDAEKANPNVIATPLWEVPRALVASRDTQYADRGWALALCDVTSALNERTALSAAVPLCFATHNLPLITVCEGDARASLLFLGILSSLALDYFARLRVATNHLTEGIFRSLPIPSPNYIRELSVILFGDEWGVARRALELSYTCVDLAHLGEQTRWCDKPYTWDPERRLLLEAELHAFGFAAYGISTVEASQIMLDFGILRRKDEREYGRFRTHDLVCAQLEMWGSAKIGPTIVKELAG